MHPARTTAKNGSKNLERRDPPEPQPELRPRLSCAAANEKCTRGEESSSRIATYDRPVLVIMGLTGWDRPPARIAPQGD